MNKRKRNHKAVDKRTRTFKKIRYSIHRNECLRGQEKLKSSTKPKDKKETHPRPEFYILNIFKLISCISTIKPKRMLIN